MSKGLLATCVLVCAFSLADRAAAENEPGTAGAPDAQETDHASEPKPEDRASSTDTPSAEPKKKPGTGKTDPQPEGTEPLDGGPAVEPKKIPEPEAKPGAKPDDGKKAGDVPPGESKKKAEPEPKAGTKPDDGKKADDVPSDEPKKKAEPERKPDAKPNDAKKPEEAQPAEPKKKPEERKSDSKSNGAKKSEEAQPAEPKKKPEPERKPDGKPNDVKPAEEAPPPATKPEEPAKKPITSLNLSIKLTLMADPALFPFEIEVEMDKHKAVLRGTVPTEEDKIKAGEIAKTVEGVESVGNQLTVNAAVQAARTKKLDEAITQLVKERLSRSETLKAVGFDVKAENGIVSLSGRTHYQVIALEAAEAARQVPGVRAVNTAAVQLIGKD